MQEGNAAQAKALFGPYEIMETIGQGGMGIVYRAYDAHLQRDVALKVLRDDLRSQAHLVARFKREAEAYATLNHPNIVHIYSVGSVGRIPYIAMEYIEGPPVSRLMKTVGRMDWKRALKIGRDVALALECAHNHCIIHRDIKPGNIIVDKNDRTFVTDFGIAKVLTAETQLTVDGSRLGTPQYMSPERCQNHEITNSSDLYSLGILLFQMICGRLPYEAKTPVSLIRKIVFDPPRRLHEFMPEVPEDVERLVAWMIEKKPENRPSDAATLVLAMDRVIEGKPLASGGRSMEEALGAYRVGLDTPLPDGDTRSNDTRTGTIHGTLQRWRRAARPVVLVNLFAVVLLALSAGFFFTGLDLSEPGASPVGDTGWSDVTPLFEQIQETPAIKAIRPTLAGVQVSDFAWASEGDTIALRYTLDAGANTSRTILATYNERTRSESILADYQSAGVGIRLFGSVGQDLLLGTDNAVHRLRKDSDSAISILPVKVPTPLAIHPDGGRIALVSRTASQDTLLEHRFETKESSEVTRELFVGSGALMTPRYDAAGERVYFLQEKVSGQRELLALDEEGATVLATGDFTLSSHALTRDGSAILVIEDGVATLLDAMDGRVVLYAGEVIEAIVCGSDNTLLYTARDRHDKVQLWRRALSEGARGEQLTYLSSGLSGGPFLSPDGRRAAVLSSGGAARSTVYLVEL